jgi:hypothetical protein
MAFLESAVLSSSGVVIVTHTFYHHYPSRYRPFTACSGSAELMNLFGHLVGLLGWGISPVQGLYPYRTTQHRKMWTHIHALSRI